MAARFMLDTDMFSYVVNDRYPGLRARFAAEKDSLCLSAVTYAEALYGARKKMSTRLDGLIALFSELVEIKPWTDADASVYADIRVALERAGTPIGGDDMLIAAAAKRHGLVLVTNNTAHFSRVEGLKLENWIGE